jgi:hypothetical protein
VGGSWLRAVLRSSETAGERQTSSLPDLQHLKDCNMLQVFFFRTYIQFRIDVLKSAYSGSKLNFTHTDSNMS